MRAAQLTTDGYCTGMAGAAQRRLNSRRLALVALWYGMAMSGLVFWYMVFGVLGKLF